MKNLLGVLLVVAITVAGCGQEGTLPPVGEEGEAAVHATAVAMPESEDDGNPTSVPEAPTSQAQPEFLQITLEPMLAPDQVLLKEDYFEALRSIIEERATALGIESISVEAQSQGDTLETLVVTMPFVSNPDLVVETLISGGVLEFVNTGGNFLDQDMVINTTHYPTMTQDLQADIDAGKAPPANIQYPEIVFETVMTGEIVQSIEAIQDQFGTWWLQLQLTDEGSDQFHTYTGEHIGESLGVVVDGQVLSAPTINAAIEGEALVYGGSTPEEAEAMAARLRYGPLPIALKVKD